MMRVFRTVIFFVFIIITPLFLFAQQQYLFAHLHTRDGLALETVNAVVQDEKGFIWIATGNGLQRYDGHNFLTFRHNDDDSNSLSASRVTWLKKDTKNRLWLLMEDNQLGYFNPSTFKFHKVPVRADLDDLHRLDGRLFTDSLGYVFFLMGKNSVYTYNEKADEFSAAYNPFLFPKNWTTLWLFYDGQDNNYWFGSDSGLVKYNIKSKTLSYRNHNTDNDDVINALGDITTVIQPHLDKSGKFWMVSWFDGTIHVLSYDKKTHIRKDWQKDMLMLNRGIYYEVTSFVEQQDGNFWITGPNMFAHYLRGSNSFEFIKSGGPGEYNILYDGVNTIYEDREHNIWTCTNKGLYRFNPAAQLFHTCFLRPYNKDTIYYPDVDDFIQLQNKNLIVSTWGNGLLAYDSALKPVYSNVVDQSVKLGEGMDWSILQRKNGDIWRGHQGGYLYIYHDSTKTTSLLKPEIFNHSTIRQIAEDSNGNIWFGTHAGLIVKWVANSNSFIAMQKFFGPVHRLYIDRKNNVWVCLRDDGLACLNSYDGSILHRYTTTAPQHKKLMFAGANDIIQYNDSLYFIASGAINILNIHNDNISFLHSKNNAFTNTVTNLVLDSAGLLWIGGESGIYSMNLQTEVASTYDENDGLQQETINGAASYTLPDGRIAFGRMHDFVVFNPYEIRAGDALPPPVTITNFSVMNNALLVDSLLQQTNIDFPYDKNAITIQFATLTYQNQYGLYYKLEGLDKDWIFSYGSEAVYNYLPPGTYTFKVFAQNADGKRNKKITEIKFIIAAPFWKTWWFYSLLILLVAALLFWYDRARMQRKAALQLMRSNISDNLHTQVNNALQDINILSEIASIKVDAELQQSKNYISEINFKSRNTIAAMDDMLWSINPENDTMEKFISRSKEFAATLSYTNNAVADVQAEKRVLLLKPDMKLRHELMMLYKTALNWLVSEMQAKQTAIQLHYINSQLQINMFADAIKPSMQQENSIERKLKEKAHAINATADVLVEDKGVGIIINMKM